MKAKDSGRVKPNEVERERQHMEKRKRKADHALQHQTRNQSYQETSK
jgi:hypothetical protein